MANDIDLVSKFLAVLAEVYKIESKTSSMDAITQNVEFSAANEVKVMKMTTVGLGTYDRAAGYPAGDIVAEWATMTLAAERGRAFSLDRMDNEESLGLILGNVIRAWMREHVAPELDAYRFAKYASTANVGVVDTPATLTASTIVAALDAAVLTMNEAEVPMDGRKLFISATCHQFLEQAISRTLANESGVNRRVATFDGMEVIPVPQTRFYTKVTLDAGATSSAGGYSKNTDGKDINFMIVHPSAVLQPVKLNNLKYFAPEVNQVSDGHLWQYRLYHDAFVMPNHEAGIYVHHKA